MCESLAVKVVGDKEEVLMENVAKLIPQGELIVLEGLFGDRLEFKGRIDRIDFMGHKIYLKVES